MDGSIKFHDTGERDAAYRFSARKLTPELTSFVNHYVYCVSCIDVSVYDSVS